MHLVAAERLALPRSEKATPKQVVAVEAETSSGAFKKGIIIGALGLLRPTFASKLIIATGIFLDDHTCIRRIPAIGPITEQ